MAHSPETRAAVRRSYVYDRLPLETAAARHGVGYNSARRWKRSAQGSGDDWDRARAASRMASGGLGEVTNQVLEDFAHLFQSTMEEIKQGEHDGIAKAEALSRLSDAYTKTMAAAAKGSPEIARLAVALDVIERFSKYVRDHYPEHAEALITVLEPFGEEIAEAYG